ncbi:MULTISPECIES: hemolysin family protein [Prochlorococcus]|uniref:Conserved membrane protein containing two CBS domains n=1 Tax=Prochlorococcus marinus (strain SARG / CCMP1375 / SS120) TaxID=167539 RepID=Q7VDR2_PROMA|nr:MULTISPECIES: hemolysin family protein [Prochlorococcus]AAP99352.1 Conserved membrane protein containing two CBS domains [Prochlorococcus marinus subsp. marinus str. CCMP1375]KGG11377.1 CBS-domain containing hemolysin [Prochlorococcus marinus str. LG]KGG18668.1 CBS-domain containing hemolysin [Prochlorococcus marinus str. SS2]KGG22941.1 CBS-domain containing hemolysin [Prochlorococcus marinus str. SS35]KGG34045.1 CBS-domain containing hemolysin [Prochlorococcus marinus str. SS51]
MQFLLLGILIALPAIFAAGELAILRIRPSRVETLIEENQSGASSAQRLQRKLRRVLIVTQLGVTLSLVALGWLINNFANNSWGTAQEGTRPFLNIALFLFFGILATLIGGLIPKALVLNRTERAALNLSPFLEAIMTIIAPLLFLLEKISSALLKFVGLNTRWDSLVSALSAGELETLIERGRVTGLRPDEKNILEGVFALRDTQVREIMVPRSGMVTLPSNVEFSQLMKEVHLSRHARFLVTGKSLDDVLGVLDLRQLADPISKGTMQLNSPLMKYIQPIPKVLETCTLDKILPLIKSGNPFLLVVDEHGGTEGLITLADLTGEIVGDEIESRKEPFLRKIESNPEKWLSAGDLEIIEINRQLNVALPEANNYHTLAGFLLEKFQQVPSKGDALLENGIHFEINSMKGPRIETVKVILPQKAPKEDL